MASKSFFLLALLAFMATTATSHHSSTGTQTYIVHMDAVEVAALDRSLAGTKRWYDAVIESMLELSTQEDHDTDNEGEVEGPELLYVYETVVSGFAAKLSARHAESLKHVHGFLSAIPDDMLIDLHTTHSPQFLGLMPGKGLWDNAQSSVSDIVIGVVDTGIWPEHVSFSDGDTADVLALPKHWKGGCEEGPNFSAKSCNKKLVGARAFYKGYEAHAGTINGTNEYRSARDSNGHGTHTASIAAGNSIAGVSFFGNARGSATGMSYLARIAAYKACWSFGCASSDILAAVDRAVADGVDVLSLSLGGGSWQYQDDPLAVAAFGATQKGVFVSFSAGNSGPSELTVGNTAPWIMTVGATYLDRSFPTNVTLGDGRVFTGASLFSGKPTKQLPLVYGDKAGRAGARYCNHSSLSPKLVGGKIVLCEYGLNGRTQKGEEVWLAGGAGVLLMNSKDQGEELLVDAHILPASSLGAAASKAIKDYFSKSKNPTAKIAFLGTVYGNIAPVVAAFSSRGPSSIGPDVIKPDITAPGMSILAAWAPVASPSFTRTDPRRVQFNIISGTSMSCPHISGVAALLKAAHPGWSPAAIKSAIMTTATALNNKNTPITDMSTSSPATPFAMGSGQVEPEKAADPGFVYDISTKDYLEYLCSLNLSSSEIAKLARKPYTCKKTRVSQPGDLNYPSFAVLFESGKNNNNRKKSSNNVTVTYTRTVTNVGEKARCKYRVRVKEPRGVSMEVEPRVLAFMKLGEKKSYKVRFVEVKEGRSSSSSFGEVVWVCDGYSVRSPVAVTWVEDTN